MSQSTLDHHLRDPALNNFNLIRLLAATAVVFGHSFALSLDAGGRVEPVRAFLKFTYSGAIAVDVFFLISGIFVSQSFFFDRNIASFALKRFLRIWPGLVVCLVASVALVIAVSPGIRTQIVLEPVTYSYILKNSLLDLQWGIPGVFEGRKYYAINGSLWTLPIEVKMYVGVLIAGLVGLLYARFLLTLAAAAVGIIFLAFPETFAGFFNLLDKETLVPVIFFLAGMAIFANRSVIAVRSRHLLCLLVVAWLTPPPTFEIVCYVLFALATVWIGCSPVLAQLPKFHSDYSYGIYIYSFPIQQTVASLWPQAGPYELFVAAMLGILPCAILSWHLVELPAQTAGKNVARVLSGKAKMDGGAYSLLRLNWLGLALPVALTLAAAIGLHAATAHLNARPIVALPVQIVAYGPDTVVRGQPFNQQPDGSSAIWVKLDRVADPDFGLILGGKQLKTVNNGVVLTATVPLGLLGNRGPVKLWVEAMRTTSKAQSKPVTILVK
jgi:peptidoglycan/LPS O-acetylase OafA/YrhL